MEQQHDEPEQAKRAVTITEFLEARIAEEDEELAAPDPGWDDYKGFCDAVGVHYDKSRVLAECAAKRAIIKLSDDVEGMDYRIQGEWGGYLDGTADDILKALAAVYKDHPDYQEEWDL